MSFDDCARSATQALRRHSRAVAEERAQPKRRDTFKAAEVNRLVADWVATILHPDDEMRWGLRRMRARSRDLARNDPYIRHFLNMLATNVVGPTGFQHEAMVRDNDGKLNRRLNEKIEVAFADWSDEVTIDGRLSLPAYMRQGLKGVARDGETLVRKWRGFADNRYRFALETIDPDQLDETFSRPADERGNAEIRLGVEVNSFSRPTAYHVWNKPEKMIGQDWRARERDRIPADEVIHLYDQERANQTRGLIWFLAVAVNLKMLSGYSEAELVASRTAAAKQGWFAKKGDAPSAGEAVTPDANNRVAMEANPGLIDFAPDGYEFIPWVPDHPSTAFAAFIKSKLREIATGMSVSYNALASDLEGVNYSSMRSGLLLEREIWRTLQSWWVGAFLRPVYAEWMNMALLSGELVLDSRNARKFLAAKFTPRGWPWVDPEKDVKAGIDSIQTGLDSRTDILAEQGRELRPILERLAEEEEMARELGIDISGPKPTSLLGGASKKQDGDENRDLDLPAGRIAALVASNGRH